MEYSTIFFRSRKIRPHTGGIGGLRRQGRGTDILDIGPYNPGDDIRDISWIHTARHNTLEKRIREEESNFPIVVANLIEEDDTTFFLDGIPSVSQYRDALIETIQLSTIKHHFPYKQVRTIKELKPIHNSQIFVLYHMHKIEDFHFLRGLSIDNDIIPIEILHRYELHPHRDVILEGYSIDIKKYRRLIGEYEESRKKYFSKLKIQGITLTTDMNPVIVINQFLKNRI